MIPAVATAASRITTAAHAHVALNPDVPVAYFRLPAAAHNKDSSLSGAPIARCSRPISARISSSSLSVVIPASFPCSPSPHAASQPTALSLDEAWSARCPRARPALARPVRSSSPQAHTESPLRAGPAAIHPFRPAPQQRLHVAAISPLAHLSGMAFPRRPHHRNRTLPPVRFVPGTSTVAVERSRTATWKAFRAGHRIGPFG